MESGREQNSNYFLRQEIARHLLKKLFKEIKKGKLLGWRILVSIFLDGGPWKVIIVKKKNLNCFFFFYTG